VSPLILTNFVYLFLTNFVCGVPLSSSLYGQFTPSSLDVVVCVFFVDGPFDSGSYALTQMTMSHDVDGSFEGQRFFCRSVLETDWLQTVCAWWTEQSVCSVVKHATIRAR